jgi:hypothetical protein
LYDANGRADISVSALPTASAWKSLAGTDEDDGGAFGLDLFLQDGEMSLDLAEGPAASAHEVPAVALDERVRTVLREAAPHRDSPFISMDLIARLTHRICDEYRVPQKRRVAFLRLVQAAFRLAVERLRGTIMNHGAQALLGQLQNLRSTPLDRKQFPYYEPSEWNHLSEENATAAAQQVLLRYSRATGGGPAARFPATPQACATPLSAMGVMLTTSLKAQVALAVAPAAAGHKIPILNPSAAHSVILAYTYGLSVLADSGGRAVAYVGAIGVSPTPKAYWDSVYEAFHGACGPPALAATRVDAAAAARALLNPLDSVMGATMLEVLPAPPAVTLAPAAGSHEVEAPAAGSHEVEAPAAGSHEVEEEILDHEEYGVAPPTPGGEEPLSQATALAVGQPATLKRRIDDVAASAHPPEPELAAPPAKRARIDAPAEAFTSVPQAAAAGFNYPLYVSVENPLRLPWTPGFLALIHATLSLGVIVALRADELSAIARCNIKQLQEVLKQISGGKRAYDRARTFLMLFVMNSRNVTPGCIDALFGPPRHAAEEDDDAMDLDSLVPSSPQVAWTPQIMPPALHRPAIFTYMTMLREVATPAWAAEFRLREAAFFTGMRQPVSEATAVGVWHQFLAAGSDPLHDARERGLATAMLYALLSACFRPAAAAPVKLKGDWKLSSVDLEM